MSRIFASLIASVRYVFFLVVLALIALSFASLMKGIGELLFLVPGIGYYAAMPGEGAAAVPWFVQSVFLYFLAVAFCSLLIAEPPVPQWMVVRNLFQFRNKVLTFVSVILPLAFMGKILKADMSGPGVLYSGGGVFLVLAGIFLLVRFGSPAGDEGMSREGNRTPERGGRRDRKTVPPGSREVRRDRNWQDDQKNKLRFQKEDLTPKVEGSQETATDARKNGNVTVKPGPRRPRPRR